MLRQCGTIFDVGEVYVVTKVIEGRVDSVGCLSTFKKLLSSNVSDSIHCSSDFTGRSESADSHGTLL